MTDQVRWVKRQISCPEGKGTGGLLIEWRVESQEEILSGISCDNPKIRDLSGSDCQWSCWEKISEKEE